MSLRLTTTFLAIVSLLAALRLIRVSDSLSEPDTLLPLLGFGTMTVMGGLLALLQPSTYPHFLHRLGKHIALQIGWLVLLIIGWYVLIQFAPVLVINLFPFLLLLSIGFILLIGLASPEAFKPLAKVYSGLAFGVGMALIMLEIFLRIYSFPPESSIGAQLAIFDVYISDPAIGHTLKPNSDFYWTNAYGEFTVNVHINELGLRDVPRQYERTPDVPRVLVIGDSFTEALQVELEDSPTQIAESCLTEHYASPVEVINGGLSANGTGQRYLYYKNYGYKFDADLVIFAHYPSNDLWDNGGTLGEFPALRGIYSFNLDANGDLQTHYAKPSRHLIDYFADSLHLRTFAVLRAIRFNQEQQNRARVQFFDTALYNPDFPANLPTVWAVQQTLLRKFNEAVLEQGSQFGMVVIPNWRVVAPDNLPADIDPTSIDFNALHTAINQDAAAAKIPILDLIPLARQHYEQADADPLYWEQDAHFNAAGYRLMGEAMCNWIIEEDLLPRP
jgi:lysophospholipase L1-like esterase